MFIGYIIRWTRFTAPRSLSSLTNNKSEMLLVKVFSLKQQTKSNTSSYYTKTIFKFSFSKKTVYDSFR